MLLKRTDKQGNKYYINAFTGRTVKIPTGNPLKREANPQLLQIMNPRFSTGHRPEAKKKKTKQKTFKISTPTGNRTVKALNAQCAIKKIYRKALKKHRNSWEYLSKIIKTPDSPLIENFKLTW